MLLVLIFGAATWGIFGNIFLCDPVRSYWDVTLSGTCMDKENHFWSTSIIGIVLDFAIWLLPMPVVGKLKLPKRQKMGLLLVFGLGGLWVASKDTEEVSLTSHLSVCLITLLRLILVHDAAHHNEVTSMPQLPSITLIMLT